MYNTDNMRILIQNASTSLNRIPTSDLLVCMKQREIFDSDDSVACGETCFITDQTQISFKIANFLSTILDIIAFILDRVLRSEINFKLMRQQRA